MFSTFSTVPQPAPQQSPLTILITGASRGLGLELVKQYSAAFASNVVIAAVRNPGKAEALNAFAASHKNVTVIELDTSSEPSIAASVRQLPAAVSHIDLLWNNAGLMGAPHQLPETTAEEVDAVLRVNVTGPLIVVKHYAALLQKASEPKVVNLSTGLGGSGLAGSVAQWGSLPYGASKAALNFLTLGLKTALPTVTFLAVSPGWVDTDMGGSYGTQPPVKTQDSVMGLRALAQSKGIKNSGEFLDVISGGVIPY